MNTDTIKPFRFTLNWIVASPILWLGLALLTCNISTSIYEPAYNWVAVGFALVGLLGMGLVQQNLLQTLLQWHIPHWGRNTAIGTLLAIPLLGIAVYLNFSLTMATGGIYEFDPELYGFWIWVGLVCTIGLFRMMMCFAQWLTLRHHTQRANLWIFSNLLSIVVIAGILWIAFSPPWLGHSSPLEFIIIAFIIIAILLSPALPELINARTLIFLRRHYAYKRKKKSKAPENE